MPNTHSYTTDEVKELANVIADCIVTVRGQHAAFTLNDDAKNMLLDGLRALNGPNCAKTYDLQDMETHCALAAGKAIGACLPEDPPYEVLKALAGDPIILAASDEEELRRRYGVMRERLLDATRSGT